MRLMVVLIAGSLYAQTYQGPYIQAPNSCSSAHCNSRITDEGIAQPPSASTVTTRGRMIDNTGGAQIGLGCSSNGTTLVACSFGAAGTAAAQSNTLTVYDQYGKKICSSGSALDNKAYFSAPVIGQDGMILGADSTHMVMLNPYSVTNGVCATVWTGATLTGAPVSVDIDPVTTRAFTSTTLGWTYSIATSGASAGQIINSVQMTASANTYQASNTPCIQNGKIFVVTQRIGLVTDERLFAYNTADLTNATGWAANPSATTMTGPPFASPTCTNGYVFFDDSGGASGQARIFKQSDGTTASYDPIALPATSIASYASDSRGTASIWMGLNGLTSLRRYSIVDGSLLGTLLLKDVNGTTGTAVSAITILGTPGSSPYLAVGVAEANNVRLVNLYDLTSASTLPVWSVFVDSGANGQFPSIMTPTANALFWTTKTGGVWMATAAPYPSITIAGGATVSGSVTIQ